VIHLAAAIRDEPHARVEELNGLATARLLRAAERAGVERFVFFSALGASDLQRTRFFRAKALAEQAVAASPLQTAIFAPSIVYDPGDRWVRLLKRLALLPVIPISGSGRSAFQPIWAADVARCVISALERSEQRYEHGRGPAYDESPLAVARAAGGRAAYAARSRAPEPRPLRRALGDAVFATGGGGADGGTDDDASGTADAESWCRALAVRHVLTAATCRRPPRVAQRGPAPPGPSRTELPNRAYIIRPCRAYRHRPLAPSFSGGSATIARW
jgi:uncharacterized protein YbjT (DUF2867 family)